MSRIPTNYARKLVENFQYLKINQKLPRTETRAVWFPKETILSALGLPSNTVCNYSGIRFYLGAYESDTDAPAGKYPKNREFCGKITLVIVSTRNISGTEVDDLENPSARPDYPTELREYNDGQICPPPGCDPNGLLNF